jgi:hypothetical protein
MRSLLLILALALGAALPARAEVAVRQWTPPDGAAGLNPVVPVPALMALDYRAASASGLPSAGALTLPMAPVTSLVPLPVALAPSSALRGAAPAVPAALAGNSTVGGAKGGVAANEYTDFASRWSHAFDGSTGYSDRAAQETLARKIHAAVMADAELAAIAGPSLKKDALLADQDQIDARDTRNRDADDHLPATVDEKGHSRRVGISTDGRFLTAALRPQVIGENKGTAAMQLSTNLIVYLGNERDVDSHRTTIAGGLFHGAAGAPLHGAYLFDLTSTGELLVAENDRSDFKHASYVNGRPVAGAGKAVFIHGRLIALGPQTGHYGISTLFLAQVLLHLKNSGADVGGAHFLSLYPDNGAEELFAAYKSGLRH